MKIKLLLFLVLVSGMLFSGCFKKNVMKDDADNIEEAFVASVNGENFLIMKEEIFQATSKSSKQGIRTTTGYTEFRLTSYDLNTGKISKRIELGDRDGNYIYFLGATDGKLWYYSADEKIGLHAKNPKTLDIVVTREDIEKVNPFLRNNFPKVKWYELRKYFGFDMTKKMPMIADNSGFVYLLNPDNYQAEKVSASVKNFKYDETMSSSYVEVSKHNSVSMAGDPRKHIRYESKEFEQPDFLKGEFLQSSISVNVKEAFPEYLTPIYKEIEKHQNFIDSIKGMEEQMKNETDQWKIRSYQFGKDRIKHEEDQIARNYKEIEDLAGNNRFKTLISKDKGLFVEHSSTASDTAKVMLSKIIIDTEGKNIAPAWTIILPDIFVEPDKVYEKGGYEYVFSKGSPNLRTKRAFLAGDKLIFISMLKAVCIDTNNGSILWEFTI